MLKYLLLLRCHWQSQIFFSVNLKILKLQLVDPSKYLILLPLVKLLQTGVIIAESEEMRRDWFRLNIKFKVDVSPKIFNRGRYARHVLVFQKGFFVYDVRQMFPLRPL